MKDEYFHPVDVYNIKRLVQKKIEKMQEKNAVLDEYSIESKWRELQNELETLEKLEKLWNRIGPDGKEEL